MNKKGWVLVLLIILVAVNALAVDYPKPTSWVNDYAGVLSSEQKQELDSLLKDFETATTNQIFVCIMQNLPAGTTLEEYVNELFERWQPGQKEKDNGVLLAIFIDDRKLRIEVGYGLEEKLTDAASKLIIANEIAPEFKQGNYYQGIKNGIDKMMLTIKGDYKPQTTKLAKKPDSGTTTRTGSNYQSRRRTVYSTRTKTKTFGGFGIVIFIGFIGVFIVFVQILRGSLGSSEGYSYSSSSGWNSSSGEYHSSKKSRKKSSSSFSFSFGSSSSGSSGSSRSRSSSSGFSGGGGGSSGGGGASGSW